MIEVRRLRRDNRLSTVAERRGRTRSVKTLEHLFGLLKATHDPRSPATQYDVFGLAPLSRGRYAGGLHDVKQCQIVNQLSRYLAMLGCSNRPDLARLVVNPDDSVLPVVSDHLHPGDAPPAVFP